MPRIGLLSRNGDIPREVVLDAGPIIALLHEADHDHDAALRGFRQLGSVRARLVAPLPIVFEVFKWLLSEGGPLVARGGLQRMHAVLEIAYLEPAHLQTIDRILAAMPRWNGTLEDATIAAIAEARGAPVWTLNYRDLRAFQDLQFWNPA
jgi:predicted nucleic acid-binding protein